MTCLPAVFVGDGAWSAWIQMVWFTHSTFGVQPIPHRSFHHLVTVTWPDRPDMWRLQRALEASR